MRLNKSSANIHFWVNNLFKVEHFQFCKSFYFDYYGTISPFSIFQTNSSTYKWLTWARIKCFIMKMNTICLQVKFYPTFPLWNHICCCCCEGGCFGLVFREEDLPEEQLEHSGWYAGDDLRDWHTGILDLQQRHQDPGNASGATFTEDPAAAQVHWSQHNCSDIQSVLRLVVTLNNSNKYIKALMHQCTTCNAVGYIHKHLYVLWVRVLDLHILNQHPLSYKKHN